MMRLLTLFEQRGELRSSDRQAFDNNNSDILGLRGASEMVLNRSDDTADAHVNGVFFRHIGMTGRYG